MRSIDENISIRRRTLKNSNVRLCQDNQYRYVNNSDKVATLGFSSVSELIEYTWIRFDEVTVPLMKKRYLELFEK